MASSFELPAEYLRVRSPSAEVQGHSPAERRVVAGKRDVQILELHPVGNYAVRIVFDDTHSTGIFSWDYLFELGRNREKYWREYLDELAAKKLSRAPSGSKCRKPGNLCRFVADWRVPVIGFLTPIRSSTDARSGCRVRVTCIQG